MCAGLTKYWCDWCRLYPLVHICSTVLSGPKYVIATHPKALPVILIEVPLLSTTHNGLYHPIENSESRACLYTTPLSTTHSLAGWQPIGKVVFPFAALLWKIRRQNKTDYTVTNTETSRSGGSMPTPVSGEAARGWQREIECGEMENRKRQDNPAASIVGLPWEGKQGRMKWRKSNKPLCLYFSFITCLSAIAESIHNGRSKQISLFAHQKRDYIYPFPLSEKVEARWKCVWVQKLFDESMSDWGSRKRGFSVSLSNLLGKEPDLLMGNIKTTRPW